MPHEPSMPKASDIKLESFLDDMKQGVIPDFGFINELNYGEQKVGW
jgi:hypothetical protein